MVAAGCGRRVVRASSRVALRRAGVLLRTERPPSASRAGRERARPLAARRRGLRAGHRARALLRPASTLGSGSGDYFSLYHRHLERFRGTDVHLLEIGIFSGGSLRMWRSASGRTPRCTAWTSNRTLLYERNLFLPPQRIFLGSQGEWGTEAGGKQISRVDVLIDDGSHFERDQGSRSSPTPAPSPGGVVMVEARAELILRPLALPDPPPTCPTFPAQDVFKQSAWFVQQVLKGYGGPPLMPAWRDLALSRDGGGGAATGQGADGPVAPAEARLQGNHRPSGPAGRAAHTPAASEPRARPPRFPPLPR